MLGFIADYLRRRGLRSSVQCLYAEVPASEIIPLERLDRFIEEVGALRGSQAYQAAGMLSEWWHVFWNILSGGIAVQGATSSVAINPNAVNTSNIINTVNTSTPATSNSSSSSQGKTTPVAVARPLKIPINKDISAVTKKPFTRPPVLAPKKNLDVDALAAIERSLTAVGLMSRDLTRLNAEEKNVLSSALRNNRVSIEAWTSYLQLCQEYTRNGRPPSGQSGTTMPASAPAVIIDQETRPVDSRQILWLRQNLYHQYMMRNAAFSAGLSIRSLPNSNEVSPLLINAPQLPLESPFYSPPRKLDDFAPLRSANFDVPLTGERADDGKESENAAAEVTNRNIEHVEDCLNPDLPLDLFDVGFGNGDLMAAFANVSTSTGEQSIFELPGFDFYSNNNSNNNNDNNINSTSSTENSTTDSFTTFTDDNSTVLIQQQQQQQQQQHEEDLHTLMSEFLDVNNM